MPNTIEITEVANSLEIIGEETTLVVTQTLINILDVAEQGPQGIQGATGATGATGPQGPAGSVGPGGGLVNVEDDTSPSLGGDLTLGVYNILGQLENSDFILDGGLL